MSIAHDTAGVTTAMANQFLAQSAHDRLTEHLAELKALGCAVTEAIPTVDGTYERAIEAQHDALFRLLGAVRFYVNEGQL